MRPCSGVLKGKLLVKIAIGFTALEFAATGFKKEVSVDFKKGASIEFKKEASIDLKKAVSFILIGMAVWSVFVSEIGMALVEQIELDLSNVLLV